MNTEESGSNAVDMTGADWLEQTMHSEQRLHSRTRPLVDMLLQQEFQESSRLFHSLARDFDSKADFNSIAGEYPTAIMDTNGRLQRMNAATEEFERDFGINISDYRTRFSQWAKIDGPPCVAIEGFDFIIHVFQIGCILRKDCLLTTNPDSKNARKLLTFITQRLITRNGLNLDGSANQQDGNNIRTRSENQPQGENAEPFQWLVLEAILDFIVLDLNGKSKALKESTKKVLPTTYREVDPVAMQQIARDKISCLELKQLAEGVNKMLDDLLKPDSGLSEHNFSGDGQQDYPIVQNRRSNGLYDRTSRNNLTDYYSPEDALANRHRAENQQRKLFEEIRRELRLYKQYAMNAASQAEWILTHAEAYEDSVKVVLSKHILSVDHRQSRLLIFSVIAALGVVILHTFYKNLESGLELQSFSSLSAILVICITTVLLPFVSLINAGQRKIS